MLFIIIGALIVIVGLYIISTYNYFQITDTRINASIQEIGNQLKRQANLIPNLAESAKGYLTHEKSIFDELAAARQTVMAAVKNQANISKAADTIEQLLPRINALVESNPQLKADGVVMKLMDELRDTSDKLMYARRTLIDLTADYNAKLMTFPSNTIAGWFKFTKKAGLDTPMAGAHLAVSDAETKDVQIKL